MAFEHFNKWMEETIQEIERKKKEMKGYKYYSKERPVSVGTYPKYQNNRVLEIHNFDEKQVVDGAVDEDGSPTFCEAWGYVVYEKPIDPRAADNYDLVRCDG